MVKPRGELVNGAAERCGEAHHVEALQAEQKVESHRLRQLANGGRREALRRDGGTVSASHGGHRSCRDGVARR